MRLVIRFVLGLRLGRALKASGCCYRHYWALVAVRKGMAGRAFEYRRPRSRVGKEVFWDSLRARR